MRRPQKAGSRSESACERAQRRVWEIHVARVGCSLRSRLLPPSRSLQRATAMSSITFPHAAHDHTAASASTSSLEESGYFNFESATGSSAFQMNPLSQHPPRTPRTSVTSSNHVYGGDIYTPKEELIEQREDLDSDEETEAVRDGGKSIVRPEAVWRDMLKTSYGRDKAFVCIVQSRRLLHLTYLYLENTTILYAPVSPCPYITCEVKDVQAFETTCMGARDDQASRGWHFRLLNDQVRLSCSVASSPATVPLSRRRASAAPRPGQIHANYTQSGNASSCSIGWNPSLRYWPSTQRTTRYLARRRLRRRSRCCTPSCTPRHPLCWNSSTASQTISPRSRG